MATFIAVMNDVKDHLPNKERVFRNRTRYLELLDDREVLSRYRLTRNGIEQLIAIASPKLLRTTQRSVPLSPDIQVLVTLRYLGKGGFQSELADLHGVSQPSVSRAISACVDIFCGLNKITFPKGNLLNSVRSRFHSIGGFPRVIGAVDGTLVPIIRPALDEEAFVSRKGFHAVNIQAICDSTLRFTNVVCKWPGSSHDSFILSNSQIGGFLEAKAGVDGWLLGDSGYACRSWLLTPITNPCNAAEEAYNKAHIKTRNTIERAFGVLKSRFRCLHKTTGCLPFQPDKANRVIYAAFQLHNLCIELREPLPPGPVEEEHQVDDAVYQGPLMTDGYAVRRRLIQDVFM